MTKEKEMQAPHWIRIGTSGAPVVVFGHGWGRSHHDFIPVAEALSPIADCLLFDLPGFGESERPGESWGSEEYAADMLEGLTGEFGLRRFVWVGHSFGGRIGLRLAARKIPELAHLVIVAGAGVPRPSTAWERLRRRYRTARFRWARRGTTSDADLIELEKRFGSPDYVQSRELGLRDIFLNAVSEDQSDRLAGIACPTTLIYGSRDTETPPSVGRAIHRLIPNSEYVECPEFGHISILDRGRHQIALAVKERLSG